MIRLVTIMVLASLMLGCATTRVTPAETASRTLLKDIPPSTEKRNSLVIQVQPSENGEPIDVKLPDYIVTLPSKFSGAIEYIRSIIITESGQEKESEASATGPGLSTTSDELVGTMEFTPPTSTTNGAHSDAGGMTFDIQKMSSGGSMYILFGLGGLCVIGGLVILVLVKQVKLGLAVSAGGFALIFAGKLLETYPWAVLVAFGIVLLLGGLFVYNALVGKKKAIALSTVVRAIEKSPDGGDAVKEKVKQERGKNKELVKDVITKVKREEGLDT